MSWNGVLPSPVDCYSISLSLAQQSSHFSQACHLLLVCQKTALHLIFPLYFLKISNSTHHHPPLYISDSNSYARHFDLIINQIFSLEPLRDSVPQRLHIVLLLTENRLNDLSQSRAPPTETLRCLDIVKDEYKYKSIYS